MVAGLKKLAILSGLISSIFTSTSLFHSLRADPMKDYLDQRRAERDADAFVKWVSEPGSRSYGYYPLNQVIEVEGKLKDLQPNPARNYDDLLEPVKAAPLVGAMMAVASVITSWMEAGTPSLEFSAWLGGGLTALTALSGPTLVLAKKIRDNRQRRKLLESERAYLEAFFNRLEASGLKLPEDLGQKVAFLRHLGDLRDGIREQDLVIMPGALNQYETKIREGLEVQVQTMKEKDRPSSEISIINAVIDAMAETNPKLVEARQNPVKHLEYLQAVRKQVQNFSYTYSFNQYLPIETFELAAKDYRSEFASLDLKVLPPPLLDLIGTNNEFDFPFIQNHLNELLSPQSPELRQLFYEALMRKDTVVFSAHFELLRSSQSEPIPIPGEGKLTLSFSRAQSHNEKIKVEINFPTAVTWSRDQSKPPMDLLKEGKWLENFKKAFSGELITPEAKISSMLLENLGAKNQISKPKLNFEDIAHPVFELDPELGLAKTQVRMPRSWLSGISGNPTEWVLEGHMQKEKPGLWINVKELNPNVFHYYRLDDEFPEQLRTNVKKIHVFTHLSDGLKGIAVSTDQIKAGSKIADLPLCIPALAQSVGAQ